MIKTIQKNIEYKNDEINFSLKKSISVPACTFFTTVSDVASYTTFLPFCSESTIFNEKLCPKGKIQADGTLVVGYGYVSDHYTSKIEIDDKNYTVKAKNKDGSVFNYLDVEWKFTPTSSSSCNYDFNCRFKLGNSFYRFLARTAFSTVSNLMSYSFERESLRKYEKSLKNFDMQKTHLINNNEL